MNIMDVYDAINTHHYAIDDGLHHNFNVSIFSIFLGGSMLNGYNTNIEFGHTIDQWDV